MELTYEITIGAQHLTYSAEEARTAWDEQPEHLRRGRRDGAFILWDEDELGRRICPIVCKPKRNGQIRSA